MRKLLYAFLLSLACFFTSQAQTVIFDPATFTGDLPNGMTIVDIEGTKYLQVILDGWNSNLKIPAVDNIAGTQLVTTYKYGVFHQVSYTAANVSAVIQVMDTINRIPNPWGEGTIPSNVALGTNPASTSFVQVKKDIAEPFAIANNIQFFGQLTTTWGPTSQDTIWCGKIYSFDASVIFDASAYNVGDSIGAGAIVEVDGTKYMKISTIEWGPTINIDEFETGNNNRINVTYKYAAGTSGLSAANANSVIKAMNAAAEIGGVAEHPSSETVKTLQGVLLPNKTIKALQVFVQNTADPNWVSVTGAELYVQKITVEFKDHVVVEPSNFGKARKLADGQEIVVDGFNDDESWDVPEEEIYAIARPALGTVTNEDVSSGVFQALWDESYLYLFFDITDDDPVELDAASTQPWNNDGVEIFVDRLNRHYQGEARIEGDQHQLRLNLTEGPAMGDHGMSNFFGDNDTTNIQFAYSKGGSYYAIEAAIPMAAIFRTSANTNAEALADAAAALGQGLKIGFEASLLDASAPDVRVSILNWANKTGQDVAYTSPEHWGQITLAGADGDTVSVFQKPVVKSLGIYPNPANSYIYIDAENVKSVEVYNIAGTKVMVDDQLYLNVAELSTGLYIVKATDKTGVVSVGKFNKQ